jgi:hypothetical protein
MWYIAGSGTDSVMRKRYCVTDSVICWTLFCRRLCTKFSLLVPLLRTFCNLSQEDVMMRRKCTTRREHTRRRGLTSTPEAPEDTQKTLRERQIRLGGFSMHTASSARAHCIEAWMMSWHYSTVTSIHHTYFVRTGICTIILESWVPPAGRQIRQLYLERTSRYPPPPIHSIFCASQIDLTHHPYPIPLYRTYGRAHGSSRFRRW